MFCTMHVKTFFLDFLDLMEKDNVWLLANCDYLFNAHPSNDVYLPI